MQFTGENIKYCLLAWDFEEEETGNAYGTKELPISGLYNWANALNGKRMYPQTDEELAQFNLFHINITGRNLLLLSTFLKTMPAGAKLLLNVDLSVELWQNVYNYPDFFLDQINRADYIFAVEPLMADILGRALKRKVGCIPHPVAYEELTKLRCKDRLNQIGVALHRYDMNYVMPHYVVKELPKGWQSIALGSTEKKSKMLHLYTFAKEACAFEDLMKLTATLYAVYETYTIHSYGRYSLECAVLGVPCVGPKMVSSIAHCFPELATEQSYDLKGSSKLLRKLIEDFDFYTEVARGGMEKARDYSYEASKKKLVEFLNSGQ